MKETKKNINKYLRCIEEDCQTIFKAFVIDSKKGDDPLCCVVCGSKKVVKIDE